MAAGIDPNNRVLEHWFISDMVEWFESWRLFSRHNIHISIAATTLYLITIFGLKIWMRNRAPYDIKILLTIWNLMLAIFSIAGAVRMTSESLNFLSQHGWHELCCIEDEYLTDVRRFWGTLFVLSKFIEFGDSLFLVLRKKKLIFLHWFHHASVAIYAWIGLSDIYSLLAIVVPINYSVHAVMYTYYTLMAVGYRMSKWFAPAITTAQIIQMIIGAYATTYVAYQKKMGNRCQSSDLVVYYSLFLFVIYGLLFLKYFVQTCYKIENRWYGIESQEYTVGGK